MANNKNLSNILLENIDNEIPITFDLIAASKQAAETTACPTRSKSPYQRCLRIIYNRKFCFCKQN